MWGVEVIAKDTRVVDGRGGEMTHTLRQQRTRTQLSEVALSAWSKSKPRKRAQ